MLFCKLLPVCARRKSGFGLEIAIVVAGGAKAALHRNLGDGQLGFEQQPFALQQADVIDILEDRAAHVFLEQAAAGAFG